MRVRRVWKFDAYEDTHRIAKTHCKKHGRPIKGFVDEAIRELIGRNDEDEAKLDRELDLYAPEKKAPRSESWEREPFWKKH